MCLLILAFSLERSSSWYSSIKSLVMLDSLPTMRNDTCIPITQTRSPGIHHRQQLRISLCHSFRRLMICSALLPHHQRSQSHLFRLFTVVALVLMGQVEDMAKFHGLEKIFRLPCAYSCNTLVGASIDQGSRYCRVSLDHRDIELWYKEATDDKSSDLHPKVACPRGMIRLPPTSLS